MDDDNQELALQQQAEEGGDTREVYLREGRTLKVTAQGGEELVEIRAASGQVELRIRLTEQGPVLQMEAVRMTLKAAETVEIDAKQVALKGQESVTIASQGELKLASTGETKVESESDVRVVGKAIHLN
jgi:phage gp45-like